MQSEVFEAFREIGISNEAAIKAAGALSKRADDVVGVKPDLLVLKWMVGVSITLQIGTFWSMFTILQKMH
jgi:hypothetical protein